MTDPRQIMMARAARALRAKLTEGANFASEAERRASEVALLTLDLATARKSKPRLGGPGVLVPPRAYPEGFTQPSMLIEHGPLRVECEPGCETYDQGAGAVKAALKASDVAEGWVPLFLNLVRPHCEGE